ncbi:MAG: DUF2993 domain-containing protein [Nocardiopsaceae bacterium]|nr:DUF2993 domain-containing protein [Nocardiopsaceae bacterium]
MSKDPMLPEKPLPRRPGRRRRRPVIAVVPVLVVLLGLLVIADRVGNAIAENDLATQAQRSGLPVKPSVDITGFPFLTQFAARDFREIRISATDVPAGPLSISRIEATATGVRPDSSFHAATVDHIAGTGLVTFEALASAGTGGAGGGPGIVSLSADGPDQVKITAGPVTEDARVVRTGPSTVSVQVVDRGDLISGVLSSFGSFSFTIPKLPGGMEITSLRVTTRGVSLAFAASNAQLTQ